MTAPKNSLTTALGRVVALLDGLKIDFFVLGGLAVGALGEPRFTYDIDLDIFLEKEKAPPFFKKALTRGFTLKPEDCQETVLQFGTARMFWQDVPIDLIFASTDLEHSVLARRKRQKLLGQNVWLPSPEDLILLKLIPAREKDLLDAGSVTDRHRSNLDIAYLEKWAQTVGEQAEDFRVLHAVKQLLKQA